MGLSWLWMIRNWYKRSYFRTLKMRRTYRVHRSHTDQMVYTQRIELHWVHWIIEAKIYVNFTSRIHFEFKICWYLIKKAPLCRFLSLSSSQLSFVEFSVFTKYWEVSPITLPTAWDIESTLSMEFICGLYEWSLWTAYYEAYGEFTLSFGWVSPFPSHWNHLLTSFANFIWLKSAILIGTFN